MVKLTRPSDDKAGIAAEVSRVAGVPAGYASMVSASWHALSLRCSDASACDAAIDRLRQARATFEAVELDGQTTVMVTHDAGAAAYADRVVLLADGRIAGDIDNPDRASVTEALQNLGAHR